MAAKMYADSIGGRLLDGGAGAGGDALKSDHMIIKSTGLSLARGGRAGPPCRKRLGWTISRLVNDGAYL